MYERPWNNRLVCAEGPEHSNTRRPLAKVKLH